MSLPGTLVKQVGPKFISLIQKMKPTPGAFQSIMMRLGLSSLPTVGRLVELAKANPVTAGLIIADAYGVASQEFEDFKREHAEAAKQLALFTFQVDEVSDTSSVADLDLFSEEFSVISDAISQLGSMDRLLILKRALNLSDDHYRLYQSVKSLSGRMA